MSKEAIPVSVWVVEQGHYSDYRVIGVYSSKKNADMITEKINGGETYGETYRDKATVARWPLNPAVEELNQGLKQFSVTMIADGTTEQCELRNFSTYELGGSMELWKRTEAPAFHGKGIPDAIMAMVWAKDERHALKIVNETRAQWVASGRLR